MKTFNSYLWICAVICCTASLHAQNLHLIARSAPDSVVLRWAPSSAARWANNNQYGYKLERVEVVKNGKPITVRLTQDSLKPWTLERFKERFTFEHPYAPAAAQALYGKTFASSPDATDPGSFKEAASEQTMRWSIAMLFADYDVEVANALGLRWVDHTAKPDGRYLYRIITLDPLHADTAVLGIDRTIGTLPQTTNPNIHAVENDGNIDLKWAKDEMLAPFSGYWIERRSSSGNWQRVNKAPFVHTDPRTNDPSLDITYTDTTISGNYIPYTYRVIGITAFAETSLDAPTIVAMGRDRTPPPNPIMKEVKDVKGKLVVHWEQPEITGDMKGFRVEKALTPQGAFYPLHPGLLPTTQRQFADTSTFLLGENHFRVVALDTAGNESISMLGYGSTIDSIPPAPPTNLEGVIDTNGVVTLRWKLGPELDILGIVCSLQMPLIMFSITLAPSHLRIRPLPIRSRSAH